MKIVDIALTSKKDQILYSGQRIKKDEQGEPVLERGRPVTEDVLGSSIRVKVDSRYLVERQTKDGLFSEWLSESELANKVGKKKFRQMLRDFTGSDRGKKLIKKAEESIYDQV